MPRPRHYGFSIPKDPVQYPQHPPEVTKAVIEEYRLCYKSKSEQMYATVTARVNHDYKHLIERPLTNNAVSGMVNRARKKGLLNDCPPDPIKQHYASRSGNGGPLRKY